MSWIENIFSLLNNLIYFFDTYKFFKNFYAIEQVISRRIFFFFYQVLMAESKNYLYRCAQRVWDQLGV